MAAYLYGNIEITDPVQYEQYRARVPAVIAAHGGRYLVRGGAVTPLEGQTPTHRQVLLEFPSMAQLQAFYRSADYQPLLRLRQAASTGTLVAIEGV
jgi:uncharacterized protein (DUF1330 family)